MKVKFAILFQSIECCERHSNSGIILCDKPITIEKNSAEELVKGIAQFLVESINNGRFSKHSLSDFKVENIPLSNN